jgi:hypothetical protein
VKRREFEKTLPVFLVIGLRSFSWTRYAIMFKDTICSLAKRVSTPSLESGMRSLVGKSWRLGTCARRWKLLSLSSTTPTSRDHRFLFLVIQKVGDVKRYNLLLPLSSPYLPPFPVHRALPLASKFFFLRKSKPHPRFGITTTDVLTLQIFTTQATLHSLKNFTMRSLIPFSVVILLGVKAHLHVLNPPPSPLRKSTQC